MSISQGILKLIIVLQGFFTPGPIANITTPPSKNVTKCSNHSSTFHFDPAKVIQSELKHGVNLTDLQWPSSIQKGIDAVKLASNAMFVLYCIGIASVGLALIGSFMGVISAGRFVAMVNAMLAFVSTRQISCTLADGCSWPSWL